MSGLGRKAAIISVFLMISAIAGGIGIYRSMQNSDISSICASAVETDTKVKVFVGDIDNAPSNYVAQRTAYIADEAAAKTQDTMEAVIGLDDYYTVDEVTAWIENYNIDIFRVYMWPEGETGRLALYAKDGDIEKSIEDYKQEVKDEGIYEKDAQFAADYQRFLDGDYEVFALTVTASAETLKALSTEVDCISYVDVMYNPEVEKYAKKVKKPVSYIELPAKPDGAL